MREGAGEIERERSGGREEERRGKGSTGKLEFWSFIALYFFLYIPHRHINPKLDHVMHPSHFPFPHRTIHLHLKPVQLLNHKLPQPIPQIMSRLHRHPLINLLNLLGPHLQHAHHTRTLLPLRLHLHHPSRQ